MHIGQNKIQGQDFTSLIDECIKFQSEDKYLLSYFRYFGAKIVYQSSSIYNILSEWIIRIKKLEEFEREFKEKDIFPKKIDSIPGQPLIFSISAYVYRCWSFTCYKLHHEDSIQTRKYSSIRI